MTYALRGCHGALLMGSIPALASCSQVSGDGGRWLVTVVRGHLRDTRLMCVALYERPHRCCAACRVTPTRAAISAHDYPASRSPMTAWPMASSSSVAIPVMSASASTSPACNSPRIRAYDAPDEGGELVVLDRPRPPVWCQPGLDAGSPATVACTRWLVRHEGSHLPAPSALATRRGNGLGPSPDRC